MPSNDATFSQSVIVAVLGLAELVEEEDDGLKAEHEDDPADETGGVERRLLRIGRQRRRGDVCRKGGKREKERVIFHSGFVS